MSGENLDLSGEQDPEERMAELQERTRAGEDQEDLKEPAHDGSVETEDFDVSEAIENL